MTSLSRLRALMAFAILAILLLLALAEPAFAGMGAYFSGMGRRDRVVQFCVIVMLIALFIMIKKFGSTER